MVYLRLSSAQVHLTGNVIEVDEELQVIDLKKSIVDLLPSDYGPLENANHDIKLIYLGRILGNDEALKDVLKATPYDDPSHIYTIHFKISRSSLQSRSPTPDAEAVDLEPAIEEIPFSHAINDKGAFIYGSHSYDTVESPDGERFLIDQLEGSDTMYEVTATGSDGQSKTIQIPSSQCIINDTGDHQPYVLLSKTAMELLRQTLGIQIKTFQVNVMEPTANTDYRGFNHHFRNSRINRWYNWRRPARNADNLFDGIRVFGYDFHNISWRELPFFLYDNILSYLEHFVGTVLQLARNGALSRLCMCIFGMIKFVVVLQIFDMRYEISKNHPYVYYFIIAVCLLLTLVDSGNANNIRDILNRDLRVMAGRDVILNFLQKVKEFRTLMGGIYNMFNHEVVSFVIGNNRRGLIINDYGHTYEGIIMGLVSSSAYNQNWVIRKVTILLQDILCFFMTLFPKFYVTFNDEMIKRVTKVEQELMEAVDASATITITEDSELHEATIVNSDDE